MHATYLLCRLYCHGVLELLLLLLLACSQKIPLALVHLMHQHYSLLAVLQNHLALNLQDQEDPSRHHQQCQASPSLLYLQVDPSHQLQADLNLPFLKLSLQFLLQDLLLLHQRVRLHFTLIMTCRQEVSKQRETIQTSHLG